MLYTVDVNKTLANLKKVTKDYSDTDIVSGFISDFKLAIRTFLLEDQGIKGYYSTDDAISDVKLNANQDENLLPDHTFLMGDCDRFRSFDVYSTDLNSAKSAIVTLIGYGAYRNLIKDSNTEEKYMLEPDFVKQVLEGLVYDNVVIDALDVDVNTYVC